MGEGMVEGAAVVVLSTGAYRAALDEIVRLFEQGGGPAVRVAYDSAAAVAARIAGGAAFDVVISTAAGVAALAAAGLVDAGSRRPAGGNAVCLAYRRGEPAPAAGSEAALRDLLLAAPSISLSDPRHGGGSAKFFMERVAALGLTAAVAPKLLLTPGGQGAVPVAAGRAAIGVAQTSEIAMLPDLAAAPLLPGHPDGVAMYEVALAPGAPAAAARLAAVLTGAAGDAARRRCGLAEEF